MRCATLIVFCSAGLAGAAPVDFSRDIRPVFEQSCQGCHGPKQQMGKLRLDTNTSAASIVRPGHPADSPLYRRVAGIGAESRMPLGGPPLSAVQVELIRQWIDEGATWPGATAPRPRHWAFIPPVQPPVPPGAPQPVDAFIRARLAKDNLSPAPPAGRTTLLRRLSLDLTGLPPSIAELNAFLADNSPRAWERQIDHLLASPHYGERWARLWLDAARYADSDGYEKDKPRSVWFYRDYVIGAFNRDLPYDRFLTEQLAGDLLPNATQDQIVATGFLRNSMINEEGGVDPEQFRMEAMFDRMDAIGKGMLGLTLNCAQCHNHKFDPFTQEDYYRVFAFFNNSHEGSIPAYTPAQLSAIAAIQTRIRSIEAALQMSTPDWPQRLERWERDTAAQPTQWTVIDPQVDDISTGGQRYLPLPDSSLLALGYAPTKHRVKLTAKTDATGITAFRLDLLNDFDLPMNGPGRSVLGTGALTEFEAEAAPASDPSKTEKIKFVRASADINLPRTPLAAMYDDRSKRTRVTGPIAYAIDGDEDTSWGWDNGPGRRNVPHNAVFVAEKPIGHPGGTVLTIYLKQNAGGWNSDDNQNCNLGRFRLSITTAPDPRTDPLPAAVRRILDTPRARRTPEEGQALFSYWRTTIGDWQPRNDEIEALWRTHPEPASQLALHERPSPRQTHMLFRGDFIKPGKDVAPGVPAFLNPLPADAPLNRLGFARWIANRQAPTTARAIVNRVWQACFGTGLVSTAEDLGTQSEKPSHPELLDWLAVDFMEHGWSLKHLQRTILLSDTYQQSSNVTPELLAADPYNRLLARGPRFRVDAEMVRDIALAASGLLNAKIGGPSVNPPAPEFLFKPPSSYGPKVWNEARDAERYRRALYTFRYRSVPYPVLQVFDSPNGDVACVRRSRSNTPLQALATLNEPLFMEAARALAGRAIEEGGATDRDRVAYAFRRVLARPPSNGETSELIALLSRVDPATPKVDALAIVTRVILNLDETITKE